MNKIHKQLLFIAGFITISTSVNAAYEYDLVNMIGDPIVVKINQERADNKDYYQIIFPGKTVKQTYPTGNAYCLRKLAWAPYDETAPLGGGLDLVDKTNGRIPEEKQREFGDKIATHYAFIPMDIVMQPNEVFQETRKAATNLLKGIDNFACQTLNEVKDFMKPSIGGGSGGGSMGGDSGDGPKKEDKTIQLISLLEQIQKTIENVDMSTAKPSEKASTKAQLATLIAGDNVKLLKDIGKISVIDISKLKDAMGSAEKQKTALNIIENAFTIFYQTSTQTKLDTNSFVINTSMSMGGGVGGLSTQTAPKKCDFGLGKIAKASGKLAGYTLCKSREFIIYYKVDNDGIPMNDKYGRIALTATTVEGQ